MAFVIDASVALCWALRDEDHPVASAALASAETEAACAPALWWFEVRNILVMSERRKRIDEEGSAAFLLRLSRLRMSIDREPVERDVMRLARDHRLTVYDAAYLELALRRRCSLATLDSELARAASAEGVALLGGEARQLG